MQSSPERSPQRARGLGPAVRVGHRPVPRRQRESTPSPRSRAVAASVTSADCGRKQKGYESDTRRAEERQLARGTLRAGGRGVVPGHRRHQAACCSPTGWTAREPTWMRFHRLIATMSKASSLLLLGRGEPVRCDMGVGAVPGALSTRKRSRSVLTLATAPRPHGRHRGAKRASSLRRAQG